MYFELLDVIVIIDLFTAYVAPKPFSQRGKLETTAAKAQINVFNRALDIYRQDVGPYPRTEKGLRELLVKPANTFKRLTPYLEKEISLDSWRYEHFHARSDGSGQAADIDNQRVLAFLIMQFHVRALSSDNLMLRLTIEAIGEADARHQIAARGLFAASILPVQRRLAIRLGGRRGRFSLVLFSQELLALLRAGLSIVECLDALLEKEAHEPTRVVLQMLLEGLRNGKRFSSVLAEQPSHFPPLYVGIVRTAEGTSDLPRALLRFIAYQQRIDLVRNKVVSAAIYPVILLAVGSGVSLFLIGYVVPKFAQVYQDTGRDLPWLSLMLLDIGRFAGTYGQQLLIGGVASLAVLVGVIVRFVKTGGIARLLAALPGIGPRTRIYQLSRLYLTLGMLLEGGIPITAALETVQSIVPHEMQQALQHVRSDIESGKPLSSAFDAHGLTTPISLRMLRVGERSGELGGMLNQSAEFYDGDIARWIDRFTRTFEPLLMAAIGVVVGINVVLLYMPIFDLAGNLS